MAKTQITLHIQFWEGWYLDWVRFSGATVMKMIDPGESDPFLGVQTFGRTYMEDGEANRLVMEGAAGAVKWVERFEPIYQRAGWVHAWEVTNESPTQTLEQRQAIAKFGAKFNDLMHARGRRTVGLCLGTGHPPFGTGKDFLPAAMEADYLEFHQYGAPTMQATAPWHCLRHRRFMEELGILRPIVIGECGIDGGVLVQGQRTGWKHFANLVGAKDPVGWYTEQLDWYGKELASDRANGLDVKAAFIFTAGPDPTKWADFGVTKDLAYRLTVHYESAPAPQPQPEPEPESPVLPGERILYLPFLGNYKVTSTFPEHKARIPPSTAPGRDYALPAGTPVLAAGGGWVTKVGWNEVAGLFVTVRHNPKLFTSYRHLSSVMVGVGQKVVSRQMIAHSGNSGKTSGPHLHFDVWRGAYIDPALLLKPNK